ncbi:MAG: arylsulfatase [Gemmatimonadetes bacterium]|nr:arylsulfatase [Gemmatimonadota bacterium]
MTAQPEHGRPNIILIVVDDLGFSDLGCYGSEIRTPNIDRLAAGGVRFTQMYNGARCCPSRASLLTGLHPHQTGVGHMARNLGYPEYQGHLNRSCATIGEVLRVAGYRTFMSGKWHVGGGYDLRFPERWAPGNATHPLPTQRGFDRFFGLLEAADSYFNPKTLMRGETIIRAQSPDFYITDAISDNAVEMVGEAVGLGRPFFGYVAYTAPHWPLHAPEEDIARYEGKYLGGWDRLRASRHEEMKGLGLVDPKWPIAPRDEDAPPWEDVEDKAWEDIRMAVYAAQIDRVDQGVGRIMAKLRELGVDDNTLVMFLSDNGGCAELFQEDTDWPDPSMWETAPTLDGKPVRVGNIPGLRPGPDTTFMAVELPWANASNAPFRLFKRWIHEGGISTPFIVHWPGRVWQARIAHEPAHIVDIAATFYEAAGARYPAELDGNPITPLEGESLMPVIAGRPWSREQPIFVEHEGHRGVRAGPWKLVAESGGAWELYDMVEDRTELNDLAQRNPAKVAELVKLYGEWAARCGVRDWPVSPTMLARRLKGKHAHISQHRASPTGVFR